MADGLLLLQGQYFNMHLILYLTSFYPIYMAIHFTTVTLGGNNNG